MWKLDCKESWQEKNCLVSNMVLKQSFVDSLDCQTDEQLSPRANQTWTISRGGKLWYWSCPTYHEKSRYSGKDNNARKSWREQKKRKINYEMNWLPEGITNLSLQELNKEVEDKAFCSYGLHKLEVTWLHVTTKPNFYLIPPSYLSIFYPVQDRHGKELSK